MNDCIDSVIQTVVLECLPVTVEIYFSIETTIRNMLRFVNFILTGLKWF